MVVKHTAKIKLNWVSDSVKPVQNDIYETEPYNIV